MPGYRYRSATAPAWLSPCIIHMDVVNADIAGANICPCIQKDDGAKNIIWPPLPEVCLLQERLVQ